MTKMNNWRAARKRNLMMLNNNMLHTTFNSRYKKRERTQNWTAADKSLLFDLIQNYKDIVDNKATTANQKSEAWEMIHKSFIKKCGTERNITRIKEQWGRMKAVAKLEMSSYNAKVKVCGLKEVEKHKPSELSRKIWLYCSDVKPTTDNENNEETENMTEAPKPLKENVTETQEKANIKKLSDERQSPTKEIEISEPKIKIENRDVEFSEIPSFNCKVQETNTEENTTHNDNKNTRQENIHKSDDSSNCKRIKLSPNEVASVTTAGPSETPSSTIIAATPSPQPRIYVRGNLLKQSISPLKIKPQNRLLRIIPPPSVDNKKAPTPTVPLRLLLSKTAQQKIITATATATATTTATTTASATRPTPLNQDEIEQKKKIELLDLQLEVARVQKETALNELKISAIRKQMIEKEAAEKLDSQARMSGERGSGVGKGGGGGGSIREAGGSFGKMEAAHEDQYFYNLQKEQLSKLQEGLHDEISFHEEQIKRHQEAISRHKKRITDMENK